MSVSLELLIEILAKSGISSSQEEEILIAIKNATTPPEVKEESTSEEFYTSDKEQACEKEIEEDEEGISGDHHANESHIEHWFPVSIKLDQFYFCFCFINLHLQSLISHTFKSNRFHFVKSYVTFFYFFYMYGFTKNFTTRK